MQRKSNDEFVKQVYDLVGNEYTFLEKYKNNKTKIRIKHNICNNEYDVTPSKFIQGRRCPYCNGGIAYSHEDYVKKIYELTQDEYTVLGKYKNSSTKIKMRHNCKSCNNYIYMVKPNDFITGYRCPKCGGTKKLEQNEFIQKVYDKHGKNYTILSQYKNNRTKVLVRHNKCNNEWYVTPNNLLDRNVECPHCCGKNLYRDTQSYKQEIKDMYDNEYELLDEFINTKTKIEMKHNLCGNIFEMSPNHFLNGTRCPICNKSKGELLIDKYLEKNNYYFSRQYRFSDCKNKRMLPFDFAIFEDKEQIKLKCLIEYDGEQHFKPVRFGNVPIQKAEQNLIKVKENDNIKNKYCKKNNIKLIRISYLEKENIDNILTTNMITLCQA